MGTGRAHPTPRTRMDSGRGDGARAIQASALQALGPRLLDVHGAAAYLSVSAWTIREMVAAGRLRRVLIPGAKNGHNLRKVLLDRQDLDHFIEAWKEPVP